MWQLYLRLLHAVRRMRACEGRARFDRASRVMYRVDLLSCPRPRHAYAGTASRETGPCIIFHHVQVQA
jgi:hypothetical protein